MHHKPYRCTSTTSNSWLDLHQPSHSAGRSLGHQQHRQCRRNVSLTCPLLFRASYRYGDRGIRQVQARWSLCRRVSLLQQRYTRRCWRRRNQRHKRSCTPCMYVYTKTTLARAAEGLPESSHAQFSPSWAGTERSLGRHWAGIWQALGRRGHQQ